MMFFRPELRAVFARVAATQSNTGKRLKILVVGQALGLLGHFIELRS
jgi:hypothetical protein